MVGALSSFRFSLSVSVGDEARVAGTLRWFYGKLGFGVGEDLFVNQSLIRYESFSSLGEGKVFEFLIGAGDDDRTKVVDVTRLHDLAMNGAQFHYDFFYLSLSSSDLISGTLNSESIDWISKVHDQYLEFVTLEGNMFSLAHKFCYVQLNDQSVGNREIEEIVEKIVNDLFCLLATLAVIWCFGICVSTICGSLEDFMLLLLALESFAISQVAYDLHQFVADVSLFPLFVAAMEAFMLLNLMRLESYAISHFTSCLQPNWLLIVVYSAILLCFCIEAFGGGHGGHDIFRGCLIQAVLMEIQDLAGSCTGFSSLTSLLLINVLYTFVFYFDIKVICGGCGDPYLYSCFLIRVISMEIEDMAGYGTAFVRCFVFVSYVEDLVAFRLSIHPEIIGCFVKFMLERNAFLMMFDSAQDEVLNYPFTHNDRVNHWGEQFQMVVFEVILKVCRANKGKDGEYRQMLAKAIHSCAVKFPEVASNVVHVLRVSFITRLLDIFCQICVARVCSCAFWIIEYCLSLSEVERRMVTIKQCLGDDNNVPVYVMLPLNVVNMDCELVDPEGMRKHLEILKYVNVDGVMVDCWWGIVERHNPLQYIWSGYRRLRLFQLVQDLNLKLQVVMSFHECGGNVGDDVHIPQWVAAIDQEKPYIYFRDRDGRQIAECLTWGIDKERVLRGRTAVKVYFDYIRNFRVEFDEFFKDGVISEIEIGLGPCGELRYPSYPAKHGWKYPGIGEFQCYDRYLMESLKKATEARGHSFWGTAPDDAGSHNSQPQDTKFFSDGGDYDSYYGRFFLKWYSQVLVEHGDRDLSLENMAFEGTCIVAKLSGIHWWYKTASHPAELTAGVYNPCNKDGYWKWFAGNLGSGGAADASSLFCVYYLDHARTRLANNSKPAKKEGERKFSGLIDVYKRTLKPDGVDWLYQLASVAFFLLSAWHSDKLNLYLELGSYVARVMIPTTDHAHCILDQVDAIRKFFAALFLSSIRIPIHLQFTATDGFDYEGGSNLLKILGYFRMVLGVIRDALPFGNTSDPLLLPNVEVVKVIQVDGEVNRVKYMPHNPSIVAAKTSYCEVYVFDCRKHVVNQQMDCCDPDVKLKGHDCKICLWDVSAFPGSEVLDATCVYEAHTSLVEDVSWHSKNDDLFVSFWDDGQPIICLWDNMGSYQTSFETRMNSHP